MQRIIVKNFGPLKDIDLEIKDFMLIIGPNASGKSTLTKLIYMFRSFAPTIVKTVAASKSQKEVDQELERTFKDHLLEIFGDISEKGLTSNTRVEFNYHAENSFFMNFGFNIQNGVIKLHPETKNYFSKFQVFITESLNNENLTSKLFIEENGEKKPILDAETFLSIIPFFLENFKINNFTNLIYIPAGRSIIAKGYTPNSADTLLWEFYQFIRKVKVRLKSESYFQDLKQASLFDSIKSRVERTVETLFKNILKGRFISDQREDKLKLSDGSVISISDVSSGQQEIVWILNTLYYLILNEEKSSLILEEPEANLFPSAQRDVLKALALFSNHGQNELIINTHSHYILGTLNVLINAHRLGQEHPEKVEKIIEKEYWIDRNRVFVGYLDKGLIHDIYDDEAGMFGIDEITSVATKLNDDFDALIDLEFANEEA